MLEVSSGRVHVRLRVNLEPVVADLDMTEVIIARSATAGHRGDSIGVDVLRFDAIAGFRRMSATATAGRRE